MAASVPDKVVIGWQANDRQALVASAGGRFTQGRDSSAFLKIVLPCGNLREYVHREDVPVRSIQCNCGEVDYDHWFIRYAKEENDG